MTKNFDDICKGILKEMIAPSAQQQQQKPNPNQQVAPAPQTGSQAAIQQNQQQTQQQPAPQMKDEDLLKLLQQKIQDPKFLPQLQALLNPPQQQNAANQPVQKA